MTKQTIFKKPMFHYISYITFSDGLLLIGIFLIVKGQIEVTENQLYSIYVYNNQSKLFLVLSFFR